MNFREWFNVNTPDVLQFPNAAPATFAGQPLHLPFYGVFDENVRIEILRQDNVPVNWTDVDFSQLLETSDTMVKAHGYAVQGGPVAAQNALWSWRFFDGPDPMAVLPMCDQMPGPVGTATKQSFQFQNQQSGGLTNPIGIPAGQSTGFTFPLINFMYVEILSPLPDDVKQ